jgi:hypothetical protein
MSKKIIIEMTPFLFEDGKTYYFKILEFSNSYHAIWVYKKITKTVGLFRRKVEEFEHIGEYELIDTDLNTVDFKRKITKILNATRANKQLKNWDGIVGDIPDDVKTALKRDSKLNDLLS